MRLSRSDRGAIASLEAWLTAVVARVSMDMLRARQARREDYVGSWLPEPLVTIEDGVGTPEHDAVLADSVGLALLVVLDSLAPEERLAFVLHDMFAIPFAEIAPIIDTTPAAARQLASRARRRVRDEAPPDDADPAKQRELIGAFLTASRDGDLAALVAVLHPDVVFRIDVGGAGRRALDPVGGVEAVARHVLARGRAFAPLALPATVNGAAGLVVASGEKLISVIGFAIANDRIVAIDIIASPHKLTRLSTRSPAQRREVPIDA